MHFRYSNRCVLWGMLVVGRAEFRTMKEKSANKSKTFASQQIVKEAVSTKLRAFYDDISRQEVPQRFLDLLQDLDKAHEPSE
jgi:Anti-sigma factor NepR